jgi:hypothetical protein
MKHGLNGKLPVAPKKHGLNLHHLSNEKGPQPPPRHQLNGKHPTPKGEKPQLNGKPKPPKAPKPEAEIDDAAVAEIPAPPIT